MKAIETKLRGQMLKAGIGEATCIGCGCTDSHACTHAVTGPCWWVKVDYPLGIGVCSECVEKVEEFEDKVNQARFVSYGDAKTQRTAEAHREALVEISRGSLHGMDPATYAKEYLKVSDGIVSFNHEEKK